MTLPTYLINLDRDTERLEQMTQRLAALGLPFQRWPAVMGRNLTPGERRSLYDEAANRSRYHTPMVDGEIGCYASHLRLWRHLVDSGTPAALVLEDDVVLQPSLLPVTKALASCADGWDMVKLMGRPREPGAETRPLVDGVALLRYRRPPSLTGAYLISAAGAQRLASARQPFFRPVDIDIRHWWECELRLYGVYPYPAREAPAAEQSSIGPRRGIARGARWRLRKWWVQSRYLWDSQRALARRPPDWPVPAAPPDRS